MHCPFNISFIIKWVSKNRMDAFTMWPFFEKKKKKFNLNSDYLTITRGTVGGKFPKNCSEKRSSHTTLWRSGQTTSLLSIHSMYPYEYSGCSTCQKKSSLFGNILYTYTPIPIEYCKNINLQRRTEMNSF